MPLAVMARFVKKSQAQSVSAWGESSHGALRTKMAALESWNSRHTEHSRLFGSAQVIK